MAGLEGDHVEDHSPTVAAAFVPFQLMRVVHQSHSSPVVDLARLREAIYAEMDSVALRVGRLLREARQLHPDDFDRWVAEELPFGHETARRMMAISAAFEKLPEDVVASLPRPWQALYALQTLPVDALRSGIASGALSADTTVRDAQAFARLWKGRPMPEGRIGRADVAAGALMQFPADALSPEVRRVLLSWLQRASAPRRESEG